MKRKRFAFCSTVSLLLFLAVCVLWVRSCRATGRYDHVEFYPSGRLLVAIFQPGRLMIFTWPGQTLWTESAGWDFHIEPRERPGDALLFAPEPDSWWFSYAVEPGESGRLFAEVVIPAWVLLLLTSILPIRWLVLFRQRKSERMRQHNLCPHLRLRPPRHAQPLPRMRHGRGCSQSMRRKLTNFCAATSLLLCVATVIGWSLSRGRYFGISRHQEDAYTGATCTLAAALHDRRAELSSERIDFRPWAHAPHPPDVQWEAYGQDSPDEWDLRTRMESDGDTENFSVAGIAWHRDLRSQQQLYIRGAGPLQRTHTIISFPLVYLILVFAFLPARAGYRLWRGLRAATANRRGLCPTCGYDLRASRERCPECGWTAGAVDA